MNKYQELEDTLFGYFLIKAISKESCTSVEEEIIHLYHYEL